VAEQPAESVTKSTRDLEELRKQLGLWLAKVLPEGADPQVPRVSMSESNGMSSETVLFEAMWTEDGHERVGDFVARVAPDPADVPVFPEYDFELQAGVMRLVAENSDVPVPNVRWIELDHGHVGQQFFVMDRIEGRVPPDVLPYNFGDSWLFHASREDQRALQDASVEVVAKLHAIDLSGIDTSFLEFDVPGDTHLRRHVANQRKYYDWAREGLSVPIVERTFDWLEAHWPEDEGDTVLSWGDSRIGNMMYDGFEPVAVLDWEMAGLGPRGIDLAWMIFLHDFFEGLCERFEFPGMPHFMKAEDVAAKYTEVTGVEVADLYWFRVYAALRHAVVSVRTERRRIHFDEVPFPDDIDDLIMHRAQLEEMLENG